MEMVEIVEDLVKWRWLKMEIVKDLVRWRFDKIEIW